MCCFYPFAFGAVVVVMWLDGRGTCAVEIVQKGAAVGRFVAIY